MNDLQKIINFLKSFQFKEVKLERVPDTDEEFHGVEWCWKDHRFTPTEYAVFTDRFEKQYLIYYADQYHRNLIIFNKHGKYIRRKLTTM